MCESTKFVASQQADDMIRLFLFALSKRNLWKDQVIVYPFAPREGKALLFAMAWLNDGNLAL